MKLAAIVFIFLCTGLVARANFYSYATTVEEHQVMLEKSKVAFIGHAEILSMRFLGKDDKVLTPEVVASSKPFTVDPLSYHSDSPVQRIELTVKLVPEKLIKGVMPAQNYLTFTYSNSLIVLCAQHPRTLHQGKKMRFYLADLKGSEVKSISYGSVKPEIKEVEQAGHGDGE